MRETACLNLKDRIINSPCYITNGSFNTRCLVALTKFLCLERQLIMAYYDMCQAGVEYGIFKDASTPDNVRDNAELKCLHHLEHAIIEYNNCYDTVLQIVYFVFEFVPDFQTKNEFNKYLKGCRWSTKTNGIARSFERFIAENPSLQEAKMFFEKLKEFYITSGKPIRDIANAIKHHGGISTKKYQLPVPPGYTISLTQDRSNVKENILNAIRNNNFFSPDSILPLVIEIEETIKLLELKTDDIYNFALYLFKVSGLYQATEKSISLTKTFHPPFSITNGKASLLHTNKQ